jgi:hypothetical protein
MLFGSAGRQAFQGGRFFIRQTSEDPELDQFSRIRVNLRKAAQGFFEVKQLIVVEFKDLADFIKTDLLLVSAVTEPPFAAGRFNEDPPHGHGCGSEEMSATIPALLFV